MDSPIEEVCNCELLKTLHRESLSRASLTVGKDSDCSCVEDEVKDGLDAAIIEFIVCFIMAESIIEIEFLVFNKLCYAVNLKSVFVHNNLRVSKWYTVDLAVLKFLCEDGSFLDADWYLELVSGDMLNKRSLNFDCLQASLGATLAILALQVPKSQHQL